MGSIGFKVHKLFVCFNSGIDTTLLISVCTFGSSFCQAKEDSYTCEEVRTVPMRFAAPGHAGACWIVHIGQTGENNSIYAICIKSIGILA